MSPDYTKKVEQFITPFLKKNGFLLILSEFTKEGEYWYLRLFIDLSEEEKNKRKAAFKDEDDGGKEIPKVGVNINDCAKVSRYLSKWLDKEDFIRQEYTLEVCSRGFLEM